MLVHQPSMRGRLAVLVPALLVGACAVAATAHGGYEVAVASQVPEGVIAGTYPVITDGLALVAYAATHRLPQGGARRYAWGVVVLAAALSGLAQAVYLASGPALVTAPAMRFGVGAWPAVAGAIAAHLVYLLARRPIVVAAGANLQRLPSLAPTVGVSATPQPPAGTEPPDVPAGPSTSDLPAFPPVRLVADLVASQDIPQTPPTRPSTDPLDDVPGDAQDAGDGDLEERARELVLAGAGRLRLVEELGVTEHQARTWAARHKPPTSRSQRSRGSRQDTSRGSAR